MTQRTSTSSQRSASPRTSKKNRPTLAEPARKTPQPSTSDATATDPERFAANMARAGELWQRIAHTVANHAIQNPPTLGHTDPMSLAESFLHTTRNISIDPMGWAQSQLGLMHDHIQLMQTMTAKLLGKPTQAYVEANAKDRRFRDEAWDSNAMYDYIKQGYLLNARWLQESVNHIQGLDDHTARKLNFFTRQFVDAVAPSNFMLTNPEAMRTTLESNGDNVVKGLEQLLADFEKGKGRLHITMTDENAFDFGVDLAATEGSVVYENELMQLIQYAPRTKTVHSTPLLLVPAWINKYYILDLKPEHSFIRWLVDAGHTVFVISWVNPDETLGRKHFEDYLREGPLTALDVIESITGSKQTSMIGYCLGGTLTAITLSYLRTHGQADRVASATYLTTLIDFAEAGDLSVFIDEAQISALENRMSERGYLEGSEMATTFNMLRANDLIWSFVVNNYLLGKSPFPFDLLYWNADATRMPASMHSYYLRHMYHQNDLVKPNGIELLGTPINLTKITTPSYMLSTREDHIAPWTSTYLATQVYDGECTFTLADSGHVAGVVNPPNKNKYCYWTRDDLPPKAEQWLEGAKESAGSWWPHWDAWQARYAGRKVPARAVGSKKHKPIEPAPGRYARMR